MVSLRFDLEALEIELFPYLRFREQTLKVAWL